MRDGSFIIEVKEGKLFAARQNAGLDERYERLFRNARRAAAKSPSLVDTGIKIVIFGAFWLEARSNRVLHEILVLKTREASFGTALWQSLRRAPLLEKVDLFLAVTPPKFAVQYHSLQRALKEVLELRNRLVHFKDSDTSVSGRLVTLDDVWTIFENADDPALIRELKAPLVLTHARTISAMGQWLTRLERAHGKSHGITKTYKRGRRPRTTK
jgi:hypothetical protein